MKKYTSKTILTIIVALALTACTAKNQVSNTVNTPTTPPLNLEAPKDSEVLANMSLYTNSKYGYAIQYPSDPAFKQLSCESQSNKPGDDYFVLALNREKSTQTCASQGSTFPIQLHVMTGNQTNSDYFKTVFTDYDAKISPSTFGQLPASKIELTKKNSTTKTEDLLYTSVFNNGKTYSLQLTDLKYLDTYNKMVPTFKFIESKTK